VERSAASGGLRLRARATAVLVGAIVLSTACTKGSPTQATSGSTAIGPNISVASMSVVSQTLSSGSRAYSVTLKLKESGGAAATIAAIDLTFTNGSTVIATSHVERPISDTSNVCPANGTVDTRELMTTDDNAANPAATSVTAAVTFTDGASLTSRATSTHDVPAPAPPAAVTVSGLVTDSATARGVAGASVQVMDGANVGKAVSTDGGGGYALAGLSIGTFTIRASANGYDPVQQSVAASKDTRVDLRMQPTANTPPPPPPPPPSGPCAYSISPSSSNVEWKGGAFTLAITRTSGSCGWQATSDAGWITLPGGSSGDGSASLGYVVTANVFGSGGTRFGGITISWSGGSARLAVQQAPASMLCEFTVNAPDLTNVPSAGGTYNIGVTWVDTGRPPGSCTLNVSTDPWMTAPSNAPGSFTLNVQPNPSPGTSRTGSVRLSSADRSATIGVTQR